MNGCRSGLNKRSSVFTANESVWILYSLKVRLDWETASVSLAN